MKIPVWLDCDPGHDDALAIILAGCSPKINLLGISTVAGNQSLSKVTRNALQVLTISSITGVPVVAGQAAALMRPIIVCPEIHGESGLESADATQTIPVDESPLVRDQKAVNVMASAIISHGATVQVVATGSLTNIALLVTLYPEVVPLISITFMGGAMGMGNTHPSAEFNVQNDPESARIVMECGAPVVMVPIEVTHTVLFTPHVQQKMLERLGTTGFSRHVLGLLTFFGKTYKDVFGFSSPPLHDPVAVAHVIDSSLFEEKLMRVDVVVGDDQLVAGRTVCDVFGWRPNARKNVVVTTKVDVDAFWDMMIEALAKANEKSVLQ